MPHCNRHQHCKEASADLLLHLAQLFQDLFCVGSLSTVVCWQMCGQSLQGPYNGFRVSLSLVMCVLGDWNTQNAIEACHMIRLADEPGLLLKGGNYSRLLPWK